MNFGFLLDLYHEKLLNILVGWHGVGINIHACQPNLEMPIYVPKLSNGANISVSSVLSSCRFVHSCWFWQSYKDQVRHIAQITHSNYALFSSWKYTDSSFKHFDTILSWNDRKLVTTCNKFDQIISIYAYKNPAIFCPCNNWWKISLLFNSFVRK